MAWTMAWLPGGVIGMNRDRPSVLRSRGRVAGKTGRLLIWESPNTYLGRFVRRAAQHELRAARPGVGVDLEVSSDQPLSGPFNTRAFIAHAVVQIQIDRKPGERGSAAER